MSIFEDLEKAVNESFSYTLHDKLIFISGYLDKDSENKDLLNFVNYLLYSEKENMSFPKLDLTPQINFSNSLSTAESYRKCFRDKCKNCTEYKKDVLTSRCGNCKYFSQWNVQDLYSEIEVEKSAK